MPKIRVGLEATGHRRWFERLLKELDCELWVGDVARIATMRVRKQKTDRQDAQLLLKLMIEDRFPRVWIASLEDRDLQQLLWHHRTVQMRTPILNQLQSIAMKKEYSEEADFGACRAANDGSRSHSDLRAHEDDMIRLFCWIK